MPDAPPRPVEIDALGLICPLPVLRLQKVLRGLPAGAVVRMAASDPMARVDVPHFCAEAGHALLAVEETAAGLAFVVRKG